VDHQRLAVVCSLQRSRRLGGQVLWRPNKNGTLTSTTYGLGEDDAGFPGRSRVHADYSLQEKVYDNPKNFIDKFAWTLTGDAGCAIRWRSSQLCRDRSDDTRPNGRIAHEGNALNLQRWSGLSQQQGRQAQADVPRLDGLRENLVSSTIFTL